MFCSQCGKELRTGLKFCTQCGAAVKEEDSVAMQKMPEKSKEQRRSNNAGIAVMIAMVVLAIMILSVSVAAFWFLGGKEWLTGLFYDHEITVGMKKEEETEIVDNGEKFSETYGHQSVMEQSTDSVISDAGEKSETEETETERDTEEDTTEQPFKEGEYILPDSDKRFLTKEDLDGFDAEMCRLARNELYARHGRKFNDAILQEYFDGCSWYMAQIETDDFQESMLNEFEVANRDFIIAYEKEAGYR
ncbi:MAG: YARHG domain-containing protein, partial [Lachnospiraceae bacterium]|nr:YARHG domain-containing protein [Lachnospiraceae bacterium]